MRHVRLDLDRPAVITLRRDLKVAGQLDQVRQEFAQAFFAGHSHPSVEAAIRLDLNRALSIHNSFQGKN